jgi:hypothetical protein
MMRPSYSFTFILNSNLSDSMPQKPVAKFTCVINLDDHDDKEIKRAVLPRTAEQYERSVKIFDQ